MYIRNRRVLDIGCGNGDQQRAFAKYAKVSDGLDKMNGFDAMVDPIPDYDVYYIWINGLRENKLIADRIKRGIILLGARPWFGMERPETQQLKGEKIVVNHDMELGTDKFEVTVIFK